MIRRGLCHLIAVVVIIAVLRSFLFSSGLPAYQHDWSWPFTRIALEQGSLVHISLWDWAGLGSPNPQATANPLIGLFFILGMSLGPILACKLIVFATVLLAYGAAYTSIFSVIKIKWPSFIGALIYAISPIVLNKLCAGHIVYLIAYSLSPLLVESTTRALGGDRKKILLSAIIMMLISLQPQFLLYGMIVIVVTSMYSAQAASLQSRTWVIAFPFLCGMLAYIPTLFSLWSSAPSLAELYPPPIQSWEDSSSQSVVQALTLLKYAPYYLYIVFGQFAIGWPFVVPSIAIGTSFTLLFVRHQRRNGAFCLTLIAIGLIFLTGTAGPLGAVWSWIFKYVRVSTLLRDPYNAGVLLELAYSYAIAWFLSFLVSYPIIGMFGALLICLPSTPAFVGDIARALPIVNANQIAKAPQGSGLTLAFPVIEPIRYHERLPGGVDAIAVNQAGRRVTHDYPARDIDRVLALGRIREDWYRSLLSDLGIDSIIERPELHSDLPLELSKLIKEPSGRLVLPKQPLVSFAPRVAEAPLSFSRLARQVVPLTDGIGQLPGTIAEIDGRADLAALTYNRLTDNPRNGWVACGMWCLEAADPTAWPTSESIFTQTTDPLDIPWPFRTIPSILYSSARPLEVFCGHTRLHLPVAFHAKWIACRARSSLLHILPAGGPTSILRVAAGFYHGPIGSFPVPVVHLDAWSVPWHIQLHVGQKVHGPVLLVFRERYDRNWEVRGAETLWHGVADGVVNAWLLDHLDAQVTIYFAHQNTLFLLCALVWLSEIGLALGICTRIVA